MSKAAFTIYGCPFTAFEATKDADAFVVPEPDSSLFYFKANTNRLLNLVGFSGVRNVRLIGCSPEFVEEFSALVAKHPDADFCVSNEPKTCTVFSEEVTGETSASDIIVVERQPNLVPIAHQLAREAKAKIVVIDPISAEEAAVFSAGHKEFEEGDGLARQNGLDRCCALIKQKLGADFFASLHSSATFITKLPYNLYPFPYPTGHLPFQAAGELVAAGLLKSKTPRLQTGVAVILDSGNTQANTASEYGALHDGLCCNYGVLPAHRPATLGDFRYFVEDLPVDLVFLTAHSVQMPLTELEATFCYKGKAGRVRYAVDRGVSAVPQSGLVDCQTNYVPVEVNGVSWKADNCDRELFLRFGKVEMDASLGMKPKDPEFEGIVITQVTDATPTHFPAKCIGCGDGQHFVPLTHTIGSYYFPLVFNNACASYSGVCEEFLPDVSFYVGTTRPVDSFKAVEVVTKFMHNLGDMSVGKALFEAQRGFISGYTPYLLAGVPWLRMPRYASRSIAIMTANSLLKRLRDSGSGDAQADHSRMVFYEQQRKTLLKQLFDKRATT